MATMLALKQANDIFPPISPCPLTLDGQRRRSTVDRRHV